MINYIYSLRSESTSQMVKLYDSLRQYDATQFGDVYMTPANNCIEFQYKSFGPKPKDYAKDIQRVKALILAQVPDATIHYEITAED